MGELALHEALYSLRAMRRLKPDPVPESDLRYLVDAATQALSGENRQRWSFVVINEPEARRRVAEIYRDLGRTFIGEAFLDRDDLPDHERRIYRNANRLSERMREVPAFILVCVRGEPPVEPVQAATYWGSIFPAIQNLMLAARSRGLGTTLTTLHKIREGEVKAALGIPDEVETVALIPVGFPEGEWGQPRREPSASVTHWNRWGNQPVD